MNAIGSPLRFLTVIAALGALHCSSDAASGAPAPNGGAGGIYVGASGGQIGVGGFNPGAGGFTPGAGGFNPTAGGAPPGGGGPGAGGAPSNAGGAPLGGSPGSYTVDPVGNQNRAPGFVDLSPPMLAPIPETPDAVTPAAPAGWEWHNIEGTMCRDGSPTGIYLHKGTSDKLTIYLEGGGACSNNHFCAFNPKSMSEILAGTGEDVLGSTLGAGPGRMAPGAYTNADHNPVAAGLFDFSNAANPFQDWSMIYVPYCTGDVFFGTNKNQLVPENTTPQQFVGYSNMKLMIGHIVPTFKGKVSKVVLTGASAGGFGTALNYSMVQDAFGDTPVYAIDDSGPPFSDEFMPVCMQKKWRETWGFKDAFPPDCKECFQADGGGMLHLADFLLRKHTRASIAIISTVEDQVIRLFYSVGVKSCASYDSADPVAITTGQVLDPSVYFSAATYTQGLMGIRSTYGSTKRLATYYMKGTIPSLHQHIFRARFYDPSVGSETIAQFVTNFLNGTNDTIGPP